MKCQIVQERKRERCIDILLAEKELCTITITDEKDFFLMREKNLFTPLVQLHLSTFRIFPFILETTYISPYHFELF